MNKKTLLVGIFALGTLATSTDTFANVSAQETAIEKTEFACCGYGKTTMTKREIKHEAKVAKKEAKVEAKAAKAEAKATRNAAKRAGK